MKGTQTRSNIAATTDIAIKSPRTNGNITQTAAITEQAFITQCSITTTVGIVVKRTKTYRSVAVPCGGERLALISDSSIKTSSRVAE